MSKKIISLDDVAKVITDFTDKDFERAILVLMLHGMKAVNIRNLKIKDLLNSCKTYFEDESITLEKLLNKDPIAENMVAFWNLTDKKPHFLCSSPQSLFFIFQHLKMRIDETELETDDFLLVNTTFTQLTEDYVSNWLNPNFREELFDAGITKDFTGGNLNHTFHKICEEHFGHKSSIYKLFKGKKLSREKDREYHEQILNDPNILIKRYREELLEYLTLDLDYDLFSFESNEQDDLSNNIATDVPASDVMGKIYSNDEIYFIIKDYYKNHIQKSQIEDYDEYDEIINRVYESATYHNSRGFFKNDEIYLTRLFNNVQLELLFKNCPIEINCSDSNAAFKEVMHVIYENGANNIISIVEEEFKDVFFSSLYHNHQYELENDLDIIITSLDIVDALHAYNH